MEESVAALAALMKEQDRPWVRSLHADCRRVLALGETLPPNIFQHAVQVAQHVSKKTVLARWAEILVLDRSQHAVEGVLAPRPLLPVGDGVDFGWEYAPPGRQCALLLEHLSARIQQWDRQLHDVRMDFVHGQPPRLALAGLVALLDVSPLELDFLLTELLARGPAEFRFRPTPMELAMAELRVTSRGREEALEWWRDASFGEHVATRHFVSLLVEQGLVEETRVEGPLGEVVTEGIFEQLFGPCVRRRPFLDWLGQGFQPTSSFPQTKQRLAQLDLGSVKGQRLAMSELHASGGELAVTIPPAGVPDVAARVTLLKDGKCAFAELDPWHQSSWSIGADRRNDVQLAGLLPFHACVLLLPQGPHLVALGPTKLKLGSAVPLRGQAQLALGGCRVWVHVVPAVTEQEQATRGERPRCLLFVGKESFVVPDEGCHLGAGEVCFEADVPPARVALPSASAVASLHAQITWRRLPGAPEGGAWELADLAGARGLGTYVVPVREQLWPLRPEDGIVVGDHELVLAPRKTGWHESPPTTPRSPHRSPAKVSRSVHEIATRSTRPPTR